MTRRVGSARRSAGRRPQSVYFLEWLEGDGYPLWSFWESIGSWWEIRHLPNVLLLHFSGLKADLSGEIRRIAMFLDIPVDENRWDAIVEHCGFDYMKRHGAKIVPVGGVFWDAATFIHKGANGRWRDTLTPEDCARYEKVAVEQLGEACARWLSTGECTS
jgi:aryl sulfotransferase